MPRTKQSTAASIESVLTEDRRFKPSRDFSKKAHVRSMAQYERMYEESIRNPERFWAKIAAELHWFKPWKTVLKWKIPFAKWFVGGKTNISYNCLDGSWQPSGRTKLP